MVCKYLGGMSRAEYTVLMFLYGRASAWRLWLRSSQQAFMSTEPRRRDTRTHLETAILWRLQVGDSILDLMKEARDELISEESSGITSREQ